MKKKLINQWYHLLWIIKKHQNKKLIKKSNKLKSKIAKATGVNEND